MKVSIGSLREIWLSSGKVLASSRHCIEFQRNCQGSMMNISSGNSVQNKQVLKGEIGRGSTAKNSRHMAIKIIDNKEKKIKEDGRIERKLTMIKHPNIVQLLGSDTVLDQFGDCDTLYQRMYCSYVRFSEDEARMLFQQLMDAVEYCHSQGVYHRDIKLESLILDHHGNLLLSDFGRCAVYKKDELFQERCGSTPSYMAPEIIQAKGYLAERADLWACGIILYALLSGYLPFAGNNPRVVCKSISHGSCTFSPWLTVGSKKLILKILKLNPAADRVTVAQIHEDEWFRTNYKPFRFPKEEVIAANFNNPTEDKTNARELLEVVTSKQTEELRTRVAVGPFV